jgi:dTDP-4-amino-4,6-dideoxygalactose transaminase
MLRPRVRPLDSTFPFDQSRVVYYYLARNAIYALARAWKLSGQEVLFPAYFHGVELDALLAAGVRPVFFPVGDRMDVRGEDVLSRITPRTRAVYLIHYLGFPAPVREVVAGCRERGIPVIEDCALALLSRDGERSLGALGDAAVFCLYKTLPVPDGGALVVRDSTDVGRPVPPPLRAPIGAAASSLVQHFETNGNRVARLAVTTARRLGRRALRRVSPEHVGVGSQLFESRHAHLGMSPLSRLVLASQRFPAVVERRRRNFEQLLARLSPLAAPVFDHLPSGVCPLFYPLRVRDKPAVMRRLAARGIETVDFWSLGHPAVSAGAFPAIDALRRSIVELPCHQGLTPAAVERVAEAVHGCRDWL